MSAIAPRYETRFLRWYARSKLATDPLYDAVACRLRGHAHPVVDVGCGIGLMAFHLREQGFAQPIIGIDHDAAKIAEASRAAYDGIRFTTGDARDAIPAGSSVLLLDVLHYFDAEEQARILDNVARAIPPGGVAIIRDAVRDGSWRYRATYLAELFARGIRWIRAERLDFPTPERIIAAFDGFDVEMTPLWGATPFNNYLFVFTKTRRKELTDHHRDAEDSENELIFFSLSVLSASLW